MINQAEITKHLKAALARRGYSFRENDAGAITVDHYSNVYLPSVTTLPEGFKFENQGDVYLRSVTTLPSGIKFENQGSVDLQSVTTLPEGIKFENQGYVYLQNVTTLPEGIRFDNQGGVYLPRLSSEAQAYLGKSVKLRTVDRYTMLITSESHFGEVKISRARYFGGGKIKDLKRCHVATIGEYSAHGDTAKSAIQDARFKHLQSTMDLGELVESIKESVTVSFNDYRLLTGACREGLRHGLQQRGIDPDTESLPLKDVLRLCADGFGGDEMHQLFKEETA